MDSNSTASPIDRDALDDLVNRLALGQTVSDASFDRVIPSPWRASSDRYWTPVAVARRTVEWFVEHGGRRVLDVGSGIGKFCLVGAAASDLDFVGIEQRPHLVEAANALARELGLDARARFVRATLDTFDVEGFDCLYLYNPFAENLYAPDSWLDSTVALNTDRFRADIRTVERILLGAPMGTKLITYFGFGGRVPNGFVPLRVAMIGDDTIRLWEKRRAISTGYFVEGGPIGMELHHASEPRLARGATERE